MPRPAALWAAVGLLLGTTPAIGGPVVTVFTSSGDATVREGNTRSLGKQRDLSLSARDYALVRFDLAQVPPDAHVGAATMRLFLRSRTGHGPAEILVSDVLGPWSERTVTAEDEVPLGDVLGGGIPVQARTDEFIEVDVTSAARGWVNDPAENHGVALMASEGRMEFASREGMFSPPQLQITYQSADPPCPTPAP